MSKTLQIMIKREPILASDTDELGRSECGYRPGLTPEEYWERGRAGWPLKPRSVFECDEVEIIHPDGTVLVIAELTGLVRDRRTRKYVVLGEVKSGDPRIGRPSPEPHSSRNPIHYYPRKAKP